MIFAALVRTRDGLGMLCIQRPQIFSTDTVIRGIKLDTLVLVLKGTPAVAALIHLDS